MAFMFNESEPMHWRDKLARLKAKGINDKDTERIAAAETEYFNTPNNWQNTPMKFEYSEESKNAASKNAAQIIEIPTGITLVDENGEP